MIIFDKDLKDMLDKQQDSIQEFIRLARLTNALLLAQALRLDPTVPANAEKVGRYIDRVADYLGGENDA